MSAMKAGTEEEVQELQLPERFTSYDRSAFLRPRPEENRVVGEVFV